MAVQLGGTVRRNPHPVLIRQPGDTQRLGEAGCPSRIELNVMDAAIDNEIAHRKAGQLALAMGQRYRRRRSEPREIGRLQIPMKRLLEPENPMRLDCLGKCDTVRQMSSINKGSAPIDLRTASIRSASSATMPDPVFSLTAR